MEETGFAIEIREKNVGVIDFRLPWQWKRFTDVHHIAVYCLVKITGGEICVPEQFDGQDSLGALWVSEKEEKASPIVLKAIAETLGFEAESLEEWKVLK